MRTSDLQFTIALFAEHATVSVYAVFYRNGSLGSARKNPRKGRSSGGCKRFVLSAGHSDLAGHDYGLHVSAQSACRGISNTERQRVKGLIRIGSLDCEIIRRKASLLQNRDSLIDPSPKSI